MLAGLASLEMLSQYPQSAFYGSPGVAGGSGAVCDPNPPRPFARSRMEEVPRRTSLVPLAFPCLYIV